MAASEPSFSPAVPTADSYDDVPELEFPAEPLQESRILRHADGKSGKHKKRSALSVAGDVLFYLTLLVVLAVGLLYSTTSGRGLFKYSAFTVLTGSMQREIPQGSLVIVKQVEADEIEVGDDITFLTDRDKTTTHRVTQIYENYDGGGERAFETKGLENPLPDKDVVYAANVVGKVVYHAPGLGDTLVWIRERWYLAAGLFVALLVLSTMLKRLFPGRKGRAKAMRDVAV
jgi:signal peptidase I